MAKAKKCRKCGEGRAVLVLLRAGGLQLKCDACGALTLSVGNVKQAVKLWNGGVVYDA